MKKRSIWIIALALVLVVAGMLIVVLTGRQRPQPTTDPAAATTPILPVDPPQLSIAIADTTIDALTGGNWEWNMTLACGPHPLELEATVHERGAFFKTNQSTATLHFGDLDPDSCSITRYPASAWGNTAAMGENISLAGRSLPLQSGSWVYVVDAVWTGDASHGGRVEYVFALDCVE